MKQYQKSSHFFLIFIVIGVSALAAIPSMLRAFSQTSDTFIKEEMKRTQVEIMYYDIEYGNFKNACISGDFVVLQNKVLLESGSGVSCTTNENKTQISIYTRLSNGDVYCVDSEGTQTVIEHDIRPTGRCSK